MADRTAARRLDNGDVEIAPERSAVQGAGPAPQITAVFGAVPLGIPAADVRLRCIGRAGIDLT
ncbi:hypothetical protein PHK61_20970 [Actinomycetospora lutea]|uniref:hypothetical protein n=1 Tax=Actinomycetospora lutea TaxID=663604 RepID=UPI002365BBC3|nr:hypothetical protein [Actinomycetospora lutea]MDD7940900.1 hypothetical protein [Actinomycetospora lutea]